MLKLLLFSKIISVRSFFFWTFCEKSLRDFIIIVYFYPQISKYNFLELLRLFSMLLLVKPMLPEWTTIVIYLIFALVIDILEWISIRFFFFCFKSGKICFKVCLTTLHHFPVMFNFIRTVIFLVFETIYITLLLTILILRNAKIHAGSSNSSNMMIYIEVSVNKIFCFCTILRIANIDSYNSHIWFRRYLNKMWIRY